MDLYYAIINDEIVGLTWATDLEHATCQIELALAEDGIFDTSNLDIRPMHQTEGTLLLNTRD
tara:strand:+ start:5441 stop:5626 length:186 start_codon:yes stop_codon:yes gene_type:complete